MSEIVLHIGFEKTGSSTLQDAFARGCEPLLYLPVGLEGTVHYPLFMDAHAADGPVLREACATVRDRPGRYLVSAEHLSQNTPASNRALLHVVTAFENAGAAVRVVGCVREPFSFLGSLYREAIKWGETREFDEYVAQVTGRLEVGRLVDTLRGTAAVLTLCRYTGDPEGNVARICAAIDPELRIEASAMRNEALPLQFYLDVLALNRAGASLDQTRGFVTERGARYRNIPRSGLPRFEDHARLRLGTVRGVERVRARDPVLRALFGHGRVRVVHDFRLARRFG